MSSFFFVGDELTRIIIPNRNEQQKRNFKLKPPLRTYTIMKQISISMPKLCLICLSIRTLFGDQSLKAFIRNCPAFHRLGHGMEPLQVVHELDHAHDTQLFHFMLVIGSVLLAKKKWAENRSHNLVKSCDPLHPAQHHIGQFYKIKQEINHA